MLVPLRNLTHHSRGLTGRTSPAQTAPPARGPVNGSTVGQRASCNAARNAVILIVFFRSSATTARVNVAPSAGGYGEECSLVRTPPGQLLHHVSDNAQRPRQPVQRQPPSRKSQPWSAIDPSALGPDARALYPTVSPEAAADRSQMCCSGKYQDHKRLGMPAQLPQAAAKQWPETATVTARCQTARRSRP